MSQRVARRPGAQPLLAPEGWRQRLQQTGWVLWELRTDLPAVEAPEPLAAVEARAAAAMSSNAAAPELSADAPGVDASQPRAQTAKKRRRRRRSG